MSSIVVCTSPASPPAAAFCAISHANVDSCNAISYPS